MATRYSWFLTSVGTPISMPGRLLLVAYREHMTPGHTRPGICDPPGCFRHVEQLEIVESMGSSDLPNHRSSYVHRRPAARKRRWPDQPGSRLPVNPSRPGGSGSTRGGGPPEGRVRRDEVRLRLLRLARCYGHGSV